MFYRNCMWKCPNCNYGSIIPLHKAVSIPESANPQLVGRQSMEHIPNGDTRDCTPPESKCESHRGITGTYWFPRPSGNVLQICPKTHLQIPVGASQSASSLAIITESRGQFRVRKWVRSCVFLENSGLVGFHRYLIRSGDGAIVSVFSGIAPLGKPPIDRNKNASHTKRVITGGCCGIAINHSTTISGNGAKPRGHSECGESPADGRGAFSILSPRSGRSSIFYEVTEQVWKSFVRGGEWW